MGNANAVVTQDIRAIIIETVEATLSQNKIGNRKEEYINYFSAMEKVLYAYPALKALVANRHAYINVEYHYKSKDIVKTNGNGSYQKIDDPGELFKVQRQNSFERTRERFEEVDQVIRQFRHMKKFNVIRMYYFNEDAQGNQRDTEAPKLTWEDVAWDLSEIGIVIDEKTARRWKNDMVRQMMVVMFGPDAAAYAATKKN